MSTSPHSESTPSYRVKLGEDGRVVVPAAIRKHHNWRPGDTIVIHDRDDGPRLQSLSEVVKDVQAFFAPGRDPNRSIVDELIAERREEAKREDAEIATWVANHPRE